MDETLFWLSFRTFKLWYHSWPYVPESTTINPCLKRVIFYPICPELPTFVVVSNLKDRCSFPDHISKIFRYDNFCFLDVSLKITRSLVFMLYSSCWFSGKPIIFVLTDRVYNVTNCDASRKKASSLCSKRFLARFVIESWNKSKRTWMINLFLLPL